MQRKRNTSEECKPSVAQREVNVAKQIYSVPEDVWLPYHLSHLSIHMYLLFTINFLFFISVFYLEKICSGGAPLCHMCKKVLVFKVVLDWILGCGYDFCQIFFYIL